MDNDLKPTSVFNNNQNSNGITPLPNATAILVLGICSILICQICGIIALIMASKEIALYNNNPNVYSEASFSNVKVGRICAIISLILAAVFIVLFILFLVFMGAAFGR